MTSSARERIDDGMVRPSDLAVLRLTTSSNVVGCWTGRSAGLAPLRIPSGVNAGLAIGDREGQVVLVSAVVLAFLWTATEWTGCQTPVGAQLSRPARRL